MAVKRSAALDFTRQFLRDKPEATFAEIRDAAAKKGFKIFPIVFGRAKALEGLVAVAPYGSKKRKKESDAAAATREEPVERVPKRSSERTPLSATSASTSAESIERVISGLREHQLDRERFREALIRISAILDEVL